MDAHARAIAELVAGPGRIFVVGGADTGKTTFVLRLARTAVEAGHVVAVVDADIAHSTIGPPTTVGLKIVREPSDLDAERIGKPDAMSFVGSLSPRDHLLPLVVGTARLVMRAIEMGARLIVVDTTELIGGVAGQMLKLAKAELCRPHHVIAMAHGEELEPVLGALQRFASIPVTRLPAHPDIPMRSLDERMAARERRLAAALGPEVFRWRIRSTIFLPMLPPDFDLSHLDGVLVGVDSGDGDCVGLGILEVREDALRLLTPLQEGVKALRLGSVRATTDGRITGPVDIRSLLGTD